jgi:mannose-6-phosphate isomerase
VSTPLFELTNFFKALSIQAHPDKTLAAKLHKEQPEAYKDSNHKPEMALAISKFEALCSFRPLSQIQYFLKTTPELRYVIGCSLCNLAASVLSGCA